MSENEKRLGALPFVIGGLSYVPLIGVLFGVVALAWGIFTKRAGGKKLALIGAGGILFTIFLYGGLYYLGFIKRGGTFDKLRAGLAQSQLNALVPQIELYKFQHGHYPASLEKLRDSIPKESLISINDPACVVLGGRPKPFYYEKVGEGHYYLRSLGPDCKPFTADDILPQIDPNSADKLGLLFERSAQAPAGPPQK